MTEQIINVSKSYEVHPTLKGGYVVVATHTGEVVSQTYRTQAEAIEDAQARAAERGEEASR